MIGAPVARKTEEDLTDDLCDGRIGVLMTAAMMRTSLLREIGGCRRFFVTCQDSDVLMRLFGRRLLQGRVLTTTPGRNAASYVVVSVPELDEPVVVPTDKVHQSLLGTHDAP